MCAAIYLKACSISFALYIVINEVVAEGIIIIGVRDMRFCGCIEEFSLC